VPLLERLHGVCVTYGINYFIDFELDKIDKMDKMEAPNEEGADDRKHAVHGRIMPGAGPVMQSFAEMLSNLEEES
jgi:hypothetical protein